MWSRTLVTVDYVFNLWYSCSSAVKQMWWWHRTRGWTHQRQTETMPKSRPRRGAMMNMKHDPHSQKDPQRMGPDSQQERWSLSELRDVKTESKHGCKTQTPQGQSFNRPERRYSSTGINYTALIIRRVIEERNWKSLGSYVEPEIRFLKKPPKWSARVDFHPLQFHQVVIWSPFVIY